MLNSNHDLVFTLYSFAIKILLLILSLTKIIYFNTERCSYLGRLTRFFFSRLLLSTGYVIWKHQSKFNSLYVSAFFNWNKLWLSFNGFNFIVKMRTTENKIKIFWNSLFNFYQPTRSSNNASRVTTILYFLNVNFNKEINQSLLNLNLIKVLKHDI